MGVLYKLRACDDCTVCLWMWLRPKRNAAGFLKRLVHILSFCCFLYPILSLRYVTTRFKKITSTGSTGFVVNSLTHKNIRCFTMIFPFRNSLKFGVSSHALISQDAIDPGDAWSSQCHEPGSNRERPPGIDDTSWCPAAAPQPAATWNSQPYQFLAFQKTFCVGLYQHLPIIDWYIYIYIPEALWPQISKKRQCT